MVNITQGVRIIDFLQFMVQWRLGNDFVPQKRTLASPLYYCLLMTANAEQQTANSKHGMSVLDTFAQRSVDTFLIHTIKYNQQSLIYSYRSTRAKTLIFAGYQESALESPIQTD
jgi:hypothetical protein